MEYVAVGPHPIMLPGDAVFVSALNDNKVFVFGSIGKGEVAFGEAGKSLTEIGCISMLANATGIFVLRCPSGQLEGSTSFSLIL
jgi:hypothetical protein